MWPFKKWRWTLLYRSFLSEDVGLKVKFVGNFCGPSKALGYPLFPLSQADHFRNHSSPPSSGLSLHISSSVTN